MDKTQYGGGLTTVNNSLGRFLPKTFGVWATPSTIRNLPNQGEIKMKREPHSKYTHAVIDYRLTATWADGIVEDLTPHLPPELQANIEEYLVEMDDLRTQDPANYFL